MLAIPASEMHAVKGKLMMSFVCCSVLGFTLTGAAIFEFIAERKRWKSEQEEEQRRKELFDWEEWLCHSIWKKGEGIMMRVRNWLVAEGNMYMLAGGCFFMVAMGSIFERYVSVLHVIAIVMMFVVSCFFFALSFRPNWDVVRPNRPFQGKWCVLGLVLIVPLDYGGGGLVFVHDGNRYRCNDCRFVTAVCQIHSKEKKSWVIDQYDGFE
jgi:hypothetical protein